MRVLRVLDFLRACVSSRGLGYGRDKTLSPVRFCNPCTRVPSIFLRF